MLAIMGCSSVKDRRSLQLGPGRGASHPNKHNRKKNKIAMSGGAEL